MSTLQSYRDLEVWKQAMDLTISIYSLTSVFPSSEEYGLTSQLRRAAVSVASNIAEGASRKSIKEFIQFLNISNGSLSEIETQLEIAVRLNYISENSLQNHINHIRSMIIGLIKSQRARLK